MSDACQIPEYRNSYCAPSFHQGSGKTGGMWKRYKDQLKANLKKCEMDLQWETRADDRAYWRRTSLMGVAHLERRRITTEAEKRESGERTENMTTTLRTVQYMYVQCLWSNMSISIRPIQPPTHSSSINLLIIIIIIILNK